MYVRPAKTSPDVRDALDSASRRVEHLRPDFTTDHRRDALGMLLLTSGISIANLSWVNNGQGHSVILDLSLPHPQAH
jgi:hypothetical protein